MLYAKPGTKGLEVNEMSDNRDFESMKKWLTKNIERSNHEIRQTQIENENIRKAQEDDIEHFEPGDSTTLEGQL